MTTSEKTFLEMIKYTTINKCSKEKICPSIIGMLAIIKSSFGTSREAAFARNLFNLSIDDNWFGKCYSKQSEKIYNKKSDCNEIGAILYKVYLSIDQSIEDYIDYIVTTRRSKNGPLKYQSIIGCYNYKDSLDKLVRAGFMKDQFRKNDDISFIQNMLNIIEKYELYKWDSEIVKFTERRTAVKTNKNFGLQMYRVRVNWDNPDTQIYASPVYEDALKEAMKHEGYKVFIGDDGEVFFDPWDKSEIVDPDGNPIIVDIIKPKTGVEIILKKRAVYKDSKSMKPDKYVSGTFYFYDDGIYNRRAKITKIKGIENMKKDPIMLYGYINIT